MNVVKSLDALILKLENQRADDSATPFFDLMSGAFVWSDERILGLEVNEMGCMRAILRYRTNLIIQGKDERFKELWEELKMKYPEWIGFRSARCTPNPDLLAKYNKAKGVIRE